MKSHSFLRRAGEQLFRSIAILALLSCAAAAQTPDVRHVRWGMTRDQVIRAETPHLFAGSTISPLGDVAIETDFISDEKVEILFGFEKGCLSTVVINLLPHDKDSVEKALYSWSVALNKKYGPGWVFVGSEKISKTRPYLSNLQEAYRRALAQEADLSVQFDGNARTSANLTIMWFSHDEPQLSVVLLPPSEDKF